MGVINYKAVLMLLVLWLSVLWLSEIRFMKNGEREKKKEKKGNDCLPFFFFLNQESASGNGFISLSM